jgi:diguanylate cyclase (GGDEF)-like protein
VTITAVLDDRGVVSNYVAVLADLTQQRQLDARLERLTRTDKLTGLPNRQALEDRLARLIRTAGATGTSIGVILLGYDRFHAVNEVLGMAQADRVLRDAASRLTQSLEDGYFVARYGGTRFAVVPPPGTSREELTELATHCIALLQARHGSTGGGEVMLTVSAGVSTTSPERADHAILLSQAESALVLQEAHEHSSLRFFSPDVASQVSRRLALEAGLLQPGWREQFQVHLQPKWDIVTKRISGAEALLRWYSPELGQVAPGEFIDVAEEHSVILEIGRWVVSKVVEALARHRDHCPHLRVAINLSARQLEDNGLPQFIAQSVREAGLLPSCLEFELTETWLVSSPLGARRFLSDLRTLGFTVALDDFGVGYSSLASLSQLPVDVVKLDRSFVERLPGSEAACVVASSMLDMANRLHMATVAEGVETEAQRAFLANAGCRQAQGWLVSPAVPLDEFFSRYRNGDWLDAAAIGRSTGPDSASTPWA